MINDYVWDSGVEAGFKEHIKLIKEDSSRIMSVMIGIDKRTLGRIEFNWMSEARPGDDDDSFRDSYGCGYMDVYVRYLNKKFWICNSKGRCNESMSGFPSVPALRAYIEQLRLMGAKIDEYARMIRRGSMDCFERQLRGAYWSSGLEKKVVFDWLLDGCRNAREAALYLLEER